MKNIAKAGLLAAIPCLAVSGAEAQGRTEAQIRSDMAFARGLASEWKYVDLAEQVILGLEREGVGRALVEELGLVKCDIYAEGAKKEGDPEVRDELYTKAVEAYQDYLEANPLSDYVSQAERGYIDVCNRYGRVLERALEDAVGEKAEETRGKIGTVLEEALKYTGRLIADLKEDPDPSLKQKLELYRVMFNRGQMLHTLANASGEGAFFYSEAETVLEDLAIRAGEKTPQGLFAYIELAKVHASQGNAQTSADFSQFVVDTVIPYDQKTLREGGWDDFTPEQKQQRWTFVELGTPTLVDAYMAAGYPEEAAKWSLHFYNTWKREGFGLSMRGYLSLLAVARTLLDCGGVVGGSLTGGDLRHYESMEALNASGIGYSRRNKRAAIDLALSIAQTVNEENRGNTLQIRAQKLISDVITRPGVAVAPEVLFEAAQGEYFNKSYAQAIEAMKRVLRSLDSYDEATRQEYGARVLYHIAESHRKLDRPLEAAMAYREGATTWRGDPEYDERNAKGFYGTIGEVRRKVPGAKEIDNLWREAETLLTQISQDTGDIVFRQAKRKYDQKDYGEARTRFLAVQPKADSYEKALTYAALCLSKLKDKDAAEAEFANYVESYVTDPKHEVTSPRKVAARKEALAMAHYYLGKIAYEKASKGRLPFQKVIDRLESYHDDFPEQTMFGPNSLYMVVMSHLAEGRLEDAERVHGVMVADYGDNKFTGTGALKIYKAHEERRRDALNAKDEEAARNTLRRMAEYMRLSNSLSGSPGYGNLRPESEHWMELEEWEEAERVLASIVSSFADAPVEGERVRLHVLPDLGKVLLEQGKVQEGFEVLAPLVPDPDDETAAKPSSRVVKDYCRAITGWTVADGTTITEIPGVGGDDDLAKACRYLAQLTNSLAGDEKWSCPWYEMKFATAYGYYRWGQLDSEKLASAKSQIDTLRQELGSQLEDMRGECGSDELRQRFLWLWKKIQ